MPELGFRINEKVIDHDCNTDERDSWEYPRDAHKGDRRPRHFLKEDKLWQCPVCETVWVLYYDRGYYYERRLLWKVYGEDNRPLFKHVWTRTKLNYYVFDRTERVEVNRSKIVPPKESKGKWSFRNKAS
jgi:hypothetical protein